MIYGSYGYKQPINLGIDLGAKHIGVAITSDNKVLSKGEITLRDDVKRNLESKKIYRRSRRNRKTRYRKARFLNRTSTKKEGWLPPSIQSRIDNTFRWIDKFKKNIPNPKLTIEVGKFNVQKMLNHTHENHQAGKILWKWMQEGKKLPQYKEIVFMNVIRRKVFNKYPDCHVTYGSQTTPRRKELELEKSHYNDAIAISGISSIHSNPLTMFKIVQFRKKKRRLENGV